MNDYIRLIYVMIVSNYDDVFGFKFDVVNDFVLNEVEFDSVVDFDGRVGVLDGLVIVGNDVGNVFGIKLMFLNFKEFESGFFGGDLVNGELIFDVVEEMEVFVRLFDGDNIYGLWLVSNNF